jgi:O-antigen ligase
MGAQAFVVVLSWLLWLGLPLSWITSKYPPELGISFTSTLEQPVMSTLLVVLLWSFRSRLSANTLLGRNTKFLVYGFLTITITNIFFIMTGRTGYLVMIVFLCMAFFTALPKKARIVSIFLPILAVLLVFQFSDRFQRRVTQVHDEIVQYDKGDATTSQGIRLDHWRVSLQGIAQRPIMGHGVGSFSVVYQNNHGHENRISRDPHQQYLFWWVEGGILGITLLLTIFGSLIKDSKKLSPPSNWALVCTTAIAATMALANCPFFGAGMSEYFLVMMAALLNMKSSHDGGVAESTP